MTAAPIRTDYLTCEDRPPGVRIALNRPDERNALSRNMMLALTEELERQSRRDDVRVIVLAGNGPVFSSGHNLRELVGHGLEDQREVFAICTRLMETIQRIPQPVIAAVHGPAVAAGCQLVATCDLAIAGERAVFGTPGVKIGLFCSTPMVAISRNIGRKRAMELLMTGEFIPAGTAADWGLVNRAVPGDRLEDEVWELAGKVASASPLTVRIGKEAFYRQIDAGQDEAYERMGETMAANAVTGDAQEGMSAFLERRTPVWRGE
ncbi:enoyl-CoA hydratase [Saccharopolyspora taberi]|uniref:Enoyl-CoA hydratase domain-containing protein 3, mitochondrial n=1 Tax=Saccharopolyspora taberi TaxID=60895 RepID=A0ABN3VDW1_9PSEU